MPALKGVWCDLEIKGFRLFSGKYRHESCGTTIDIFGWQQHSVPEYSKVKSAAPVDPGSVAAREKRMVFFMDGPPESTRYFLMELPLKTKKTLKHYKTPLNHCKTPLNHCKTPLVIPCSQTLCSPSLVLLGSHQTWQTRQTWQTWQEKHQLKEWMAWMAVRTAAPIEPRDTTDDRREIRSIRSSALAISGHGAMGWPGGSGGMRCRGLKKL